MLRKLTDLGPIKYLFIEHSKARVAPRVLA